MKASSVNLETELRHLPLANRHQLVGLLDVNDNWKSLATVITNPDRPNELLLKNTDISLLDEQRKRPQGSPSSALLDYWSSYGRRRHTFGDVIHFLEQSGLNRASDVIRTYLHGMNGNNPFRSTELLHNWSDLPEYSSAAQVNPTAPNESQISFDSRSFPQSEAQTNSTVIRFAYRSLQIATDNFSPKPVNGGGTKLGEGSFGEVFRCATAMMNVEAIGQQKFVAVKRFKQFPATADDDEEKKGQFLSELTTMCRFQHINLVKLFGYSNDGPHFCIVTEYLSNGSLQHYLASGRPLSFELRFRIALDTASAIVYLHNYSTLDRFGVPIEQPFIHRDIKSANIFLDNRLGARLGDLGLVRQGSTSNTTTTVVTKTVIGTSVYMAPEAFRGDVSVKIDTFSFGVVMFELLTGLSAFDADREESDIVSYIDEELGDEFDQLPSIDRDLWQFLQSAYQTVNRTKLNSILDKRCTNWNHLVGAKMILLAKCCIEQRKKNRPTMVEVCSNLIWQFLILNFQP